MRPLGDRAHVSVVYLFYYMALGAFLPFINLHYRRLGVSALEIGFLSALLVPVSAIGSLLWSGIADALGRHRLILVSSMALSIGAVFVLSHVRDFPLIVLWAALQAFVSSPIGPLVDSAAVRVAGRRGSSFGVFRMWGTIGWAIATLVVGTLVEQFSLGWAFYGYMAFMGLTLVVAWVGEAARPQRRGAEFSKEMRAVLHHRSFLVFLGSVFFLGMTLGGESNFLSLFLDSIGSSETMIGLAWTVGALSEIPVLWWADRLTKRWGSQGLVKFAFLTFGVRWILLSFVSNPGWALSLQALRGVSFGAFLVGGVGYTVEVTPAGLATVALAIFNLTAFTVSSIAGSLLGGYVFERFGGAGLFRVLGIAAWIGLLTLVVLGERARSCGHGR